MARSRSTTCRPGRITCRCARRGIRRDAPRSRLPRAAKPVDVTVDPELHFEEVLSVGPDARSQFESFQPTSVLAGQELSKQLEMSLGATLESQPGVASRSFGPAPARPVVRGLDGDRVLILQDGQRIGDLSSQSGDHGVPINPAAAQRIEVVRGPATLLYGANAIGGLVNVITDEIPTQADDGRQRQLHVRSRHRPRTKAAAAGDVHVGNGTFALHAGGGGRRSGDVATPEGDLDNSQSRNGFGNVGLSWTGAKGYFGGSYGYDDTKYGIPVVEDGQVQLTPRRHAFSLRAGAQRTDGRDRFVPGDARGAPLQARRARRRRGRHRLHEQHRRGRGDGIASGRRPVEGQRRRLVPQSRVRRGRRRGAVAGGRSAWLRGVPLRGSHLAARHVPVRRTRRSHAVRAGRRDATAASRPVRDRSACCCVLRRRTIA